MLFVQTQKAHMSVAAKKDIKEMEAPAQVIKPNNLYDDTDI